MDRLFTKFGSRQLSTSTLLLAQYLTLSAVICCAQSMSRVPQPKARTSQGKNADIYLMVPPEPVVDIHAGTVKFGAVPSGLIGMAEFPVPVPAKNPIISIDVADNNKADPSPVFKIVNSGECGTPLNNATGTDKRKYTNPNLFGGGTCTIVIGFMPSDDKSAFSGTLTIRLWDGSSMTGQLSGSGAAAAACRAPYSSFLPLASGFTPGELYPLPPSGVTPELAGRLYKDFGSPIRRSVVNCYYSTDGLVSYFNQFQSIYNAASGAATVNANIASLNFIDGNQLTVGTNPQVAPSNTTQPPASTGTGVPTLSASGAAQAAQNVLNGGTVFADDIYPVLYAPVGTALGILNFEAKEGVDLQKFNNGSITATNPSTHTFVGLEGYLQINSSNNASNSSSPAGTLFLSGKYGWSLANQTYSRQNGFGGRVNYQMGQVGAGILISGVAKIAAYRGFGPSQVYIDSTSKTQTTLNNFKTWSIAIAYQSSGSGKSK
jgi:hypothetical protein